VSAVPGIGRDVGRELDPASVRALLACEDLIVDTYARADTGRRYSIADLFEEDGSHTLDDATVAGREAIRDMLAARDADPSRRTLHVVTNLRSDQVADDRMHVRYILTLYLLSAPGAGAFVPQSLSAATDVLVRRGDRWLLRSRDVRVLTGAG
jgi:SnoaL-like domain